MQNPSNETLKNILQNAKTIAVVGLSDKPERTSYQIAKIMQENGIGLFPSTLQSMKCLVKKVIQH